MAKAPALIISRMEIHRRTGISMAHISKIYGGTRRPSVDALRLIAAAQSLSIDDTLAQIAEVARKARKTRKAA